MSEKRVVIAKGSNVEVNVSEYSIKIDEQNLEEILIRKLKKTDDFHETFRAKVIIEFIELDDTGLKFEE